MGVGSVAVVSSIAQNSGKWKFPRLCAIVIHKLLAYIVGLIREGLLMEERRMKIARSLDHTLCDLTVVLSTLVTHKLSSD